MQIYHNHCNYRNTSAIIEYPHTSACLLGYAHAHRGLPAPVYPTFGDVPPTHRQLSFIRALVRDRGIEPASAPPTTKRAASELIRAILARSAPLRNGGAA
ncbi:MAG: hypothetical protein H7Y38_14890 [Armatimonadetes bacterium]|nr:hypothetical protein [Armatimonadota bacterium]